MNDRTRVAAPLAVQGVPDAQLTVERSAIWLASNSAALKTRLLGGLPQHANITVLGHCDADDESLAAQLAEQRPDLLLIDWLGTTRPDRVPSVMKYYAALAPRVLLLVETPTVGIVEGILKHRLHGYLQFDSTREECVRAISCVRQGEVWIPRSRLAAALGELLWERDARPHNENNLPISQFTMREQQIVILVRQGLTNKQIARELGIVEDTVKKHLQHVYDKIGVRRRVSLVLSGGSGGAQRSRSA